MTEFDNGWAFNLESQFFSVIKKRATDILKGKYPSINFVTTDSPQKSATEFPTVYIHELPGVEAGQDLEAKTINAVLYSMQAEVTTNESQASAREVMQEVAKQFKTLGFTVTAMPEIQNLAEVYRMVARFQRMIGSGDFFDSFQTYKRR